MKTEFKIIIAMVLLTSATLFLISQSPDKTPKSVSFEKHSSQLVELNELSKKYHLAEDDRFENSKIQMQEKLKEISSDYLGVRISDVELIEGYYPFQNSTYWAERFDLDPSSVCDFEGTIPLHMQILSQTENFKTFTKKYAPYKLELTIHDERSNTSNIHYGLFATNNKNQSASTYFHLSSCTNKITDKEPFFLHCYDGDNDYRFISHNRNDVISSYSNEEFCKIELDSWRESIYDYSKIIREKMDKLQRESIVKDHDDYESHMAYFSEMDKLGDLSSIVSSMVQGKFDEQSTQEMIIEYENVYGSLPDELLDLIEKRE